MSDKTSVLISGAFGQVGKRCTELLLNRGCKVIALDLNNSKTQAVVDDLQTRTDLPGTLVPVYVDLLEQQAVSKLVNKYQPHAIVHLAAVVSPPCYSNPAHARRVNVEGTRHLLQAAKSMEQQPTFVFASSSAVYGSRNPYYHRKLITPETPVDPIECYGEDKVVGEELVLQSGLPHAILRLAGVMSPDGMGNMRDEYLVLVRATPGDNRVHAVDARDAALAFANAAQLPEGSRNRIFLIGGNSSYCKTQREIEDEVMEVLGIGRLGSQASLPGNPNDELGWSFTDWFDTRESQAILKYQQHEWQETKEWIGSSLNPGIRRVIRIVSPVLRVLIRLTLRFQRRLERRGPYADPWKLIARKYGNAVISHCDT